MTDIDLDILAWEGPMLRAYLSVLRLSGYRPKRIIRVVEKPPGASAILPQRFMKPLWRWLQNRKNNYWVRWAAVGKTEIFKKLLREGCRCSGIALKFSEAIFDDLVRGDVCGSLGCPVIDVVATGLKDKTLKNAVEELTPRAVLFTGGGILPKEFFTIPGMKILHIHPGYLPHVRGADGLLYSLLLRGRPGASAFYMSPGLDEGDVFFKKEFDPPLIEIPAEMEDTTLYRLLYSCIDPLLRAGVLLDVIRLAEEGGMDFLNLPSAPQNTDEGFVYHFMHPWMQRHVFRLLHTISNRTISRDME